MTQLNLDKLNLFGPPEASSGKARTAELAPAQPDAFDNHLQRARRPDDHRRTDNPPESGEKRCSASDDRPAAAASRSDRHETTDSRAADVDEENRIRSAESRQHREDSGPSEGDESESASDVQGEETDVASADQSDQTDTQADANEPHEEEPDGTSIVLEDPLILEAVATTPEAIANIDAQPLTSSTIPETSVLPENMPTDEVKPPSKIQVEPIPEPQAEIDPRSLETEGPLETVASLPVEHEGAQNPQATELAANAPAGQPVAAPLPTELSNQDAESSNTPAPTGGLSTNRASRKGRDEDRSNSRFEVTKAPTSVSEILSDEQAMLQSTIIETTDVRNNETSGHDSSESREGSSQPAPSQGASQTSPTGQTGAETANASRIEPTLSTQGVGQRASPTAPNQQPPSPSQTDGVDRARFVQRVARAFESASARGGTMRLRLHPPELGSLRLELSVQNGQMTARIEAESSAARTLLLDNLPALRDRLAEHDIKIQQFDVNLDMRSSGGSPQGPGDQQPGHENSDQTESSPDGSKENQTGSTVESPGDVRATGPTQFDVTI